MLLPLAYLATETYYERKRGLSFFEVAAFNPQGVCLLDMIILTRHIKKFHRELVYYIISCEDVAFNPWEVCLLDIIILTRDMKTIYRELVFYIQV